MAKPPKKLISSSEKNHGRAASLIPLFPQMTEEIKKFLAKHNHQPEPEESFKDIISACKAPEMVYVDGAQTNIDWNIILDFVRHLLWITFIKEDEVNDEELVKLMKQALPFIEFIQYSINIDLGNDFIKVLSGQNQVVFSSRIMDDWLLLIFMLLLVTIRQFVGMGKPRDWFEKGNLFRTAPLHFLVVFRHSDNRRRSALDNGKSDYEPSTVVRLYHAECCEFLIKSWKHKLLVPNYAHQRIYLETFYEMMDSSIQLNILKTFSYIVERTQKKGIRTVRALIARDVLEVSNLGYDYLIPSGHNQGLKVSKVVQKIFLFIMVLFPSIKEVDEDLLPNLSECLPLAVSVLDWPETPQNGYVKDIAILTCGSLIAYIDIPPEPVGSYLYHLKRIEGVAPFLLKYFSIQSRKLCWRSKSMCFKMVGKIAEITEYIDEEYLQSLLDIYEPKMDGVDEFLVMIKEVFTNSPCDGKILNTFLMKWFRELLKMDINDQEILPRMELFVGFFNKLSDYFMGFVDVEEILSITKKKIVELLNNGLNHYPDLELANSFCKIITFFVGENYRVGLERVDIYPLMHDLIKSCIDVDNVLKFRPIPEIDNAPFGVFMGHISRHKDGYFLDLIRELQGCGLLEKCKKQDTDDCTKFIFECITPYLVNISFYPSKNQAKNHIKEQAVWALVSILAADVSSLQILVPTIKNHIDQCSFIHEGPEQFHFLQRGYYKGLISVILLLFSFYPQDVSSILLPHYETLFAAAPATPDTIRYFPLLFNQTLLVAEYMLDNELVYESPEKLLSIQYLFSYIFGITMNTYNHLLLRRIVTKYEIAIRGYTVQP